VQETKTQNENTKKDDFEHPLFSGSFSGV